MRKDFRKVVKKAMFGLVLMAAAVGFVGAAHADVVILDHFNNGVFADPTIWIPTGVSNPRNIFSEPSGTNMVVSVAGDPGYTVADRSGMTSSQTFSPDFRGGVGMIFSGWIYDPGQGPYPTEPLISPTISIGFSSGPGMVIGIYRGAFSDGSGNIVDRLMFQYRNDGAGILTRYFLDATGITGGLLYVDQNDKGYSAGYAQDIDGTGEIKFSEAFLYAEHSELVGLTNRMFVGATPPLTGNLSANIDLVGYEAVPVPPSLFLLAPGLFGVAIMRKRIKKQD